MPRFAGVKPGVYHKGDKRMRQKFQGVNDRREERSMQEEQAELETLRLLVDAEIENFLSRATSKSPSLAISLFTDRISPSQPRVIRALLLSTLHLATRTLRCSSHGS